MPDEHHTAMTKNLFLDRSHPPTAAQIAQALGARAAWLRILTDHGDPPAVEQWKFYGAKIGWTLKLLVGKRNLCFIVIARGCFAVSFVFGDKAVQVIRSSDLPSDLIGQIVQARRYAEGRGIRLEVRSRRTLEQALTLLTIKRQPTA